MIRASASALRSLGFLILLVWLSFNLLATVQYIVADYSQVPIWDYFRVPQFWPEYEKLHFSGLWRQHNEHRIIFPELIYILDMLVFRGRMYLPIVLSAVSYFGAFFVVLWAAFSQKHAGSQIPKMVYCLAAVLITWKGCSSVIATPFQIQITLSQLVSAFALAFLAKLAQNDKTKYLCLLIGAATVVTYTTGNGMLLWPVLVLGSLYLRLPRGRIVALVATGALAIGMYFVRYQFLPNHIHENLTHPLHLLGFICSYVSMPFGAIGRPHISILIGALHLLFMSAAFAFAFRMGFLKTRFGMVLFGCYLFTLLGAVLTAAGRMDINGDPRFGLARAWRYVTMPAFNWALMVLACAWALSESRFRNWVFPTVFIYSAFFAYSFLKAGPWVESTRTDLANGQVSALMLRNEVFDPAIIQTIFPSVEFARTQFTLLQSEHKSIYACGRDKWLGQDVSHLRQQTTPIAGQITRVYPVAGGLEILGWADEPPLTGDHAVLFVNDTGKIVGFGGRPEAGMPATTGTWDTPRSMAFVGFLSLQPPGTQIRTYVRTSHGRVLRPLETIIKVPSFEPAGVSSDNPAITEVKWQPDAGWKLNRYPLSPENGPSPGQEIYGSGDGPDTRQGHLQTAPFPAPSDHCLILPVLHGTWAYGQSVELRDADTNTVIVQLPMLDGRSIWERWRIPIPALARKIIIVADDKGSDRNQWLAVAAPEQCQ